MVPKKTLRMKLEKHITQLDFLRFIAAVWVVLFHYLSPTYHINLQLPVISKFIANGNLAVNFFFILSGFLLTHVELNRPSASAVVFYKKRLLRIFPLYILALLVSIAVSWSQVNVKLILINIFCLQVFFPEYNQLNHPAWAISQMFIFYLAFPFIFKLVKQNIGKNAMILGIALLLFYILDYHFLKINWYGIPQYLWIINTFLFGIASRGILESEQVRGFFIAYRKPVLAASLILLFCGVQFFNFNFWEGTGYINQAFSLLIVSLSCFGLGSELFLKNKRLSYLGNLSYSMFIFQQPVYLLCAGVFSQRPTLHFIFYFIILLGASWLIYEYVEKRISNLIPSK